MPALNVLPAILVKSTILAGAASYLAHRFDKVSILAIIGAVLTYQVVGTFIEFGIERDFFIAIKDFRIGIPGMLVQILGGYTVLKAIAKI